MGTISYRSVNPSQLRVAALPLVMLLLVAGCGASGRRDIKVKLEEWRVSPAAAEVASGRLRFVVTNGGSMQHQLLVVKTDFPPDMLPIADGRVDEAKLNLEANLTAIDAAATARIDVALSPGKYVLLCNLQSPRSLGAGSESHYQNGMYASFFVTP